MQDFLCGDSDCGNPASAATGRNDASCRDEGARQRPWTWPGCSRYEFPQAERSGREGRCVQEMAHVAAFELCTCLRRGGCRRVDDACLHSIHMCFCVVPYDHVLCPELRGLGRDWTSFWDNAKGELWGATLDMHMLWNFLFVYIYIYIYIYILSYVY